MPGAAVSRFANGWNFIVLRRSLPLALTRRMCDAKKVEPIFKRRRVMLFAAALFAAMSVWCGCAGFKVGNAELYPDEIETVCVPVFKSVSFRRNLGERLTEAVVKEISNKTPYKVVNDPNADSVLTGKIISEGKSVLVEALSGDARAVQTTMIVQVSWVDRRGRRLRSDKDIPMPTELVNVTGTGDVVPEVGQSLATAQQDAICKLARQIVDLMEVEWGPNTASKRD
jgi:hypothetical protein